MSELTFNQVIDKLFELYNDKAYAESLLMISQEAERFPQQASLFQYWRLCMFALQYDIAAALKVFEDSLAAGYWFAERQLRQDPDLASLQGNPDFELLVGVCCERHSAAQTRAKPDRIILEPKIHSTTYPLLIALHGNNANTGTHQHCWQPATDAGWLVMLPQSSQVGGWDSYVWNDLDWVGTRNQGALRRDQQTVCC